MNRTACVSVVLAMVTMICSFAAGDSTQVFTNRAAWEAALAGRAIQTESFDDFAGFTYDVGVPAFQFPAGTTDVGLLRFEVDKPSGNLIVGGGFFDTVNGTTFWRIETSTENGSPPAVTPAILFAEATYGFGADFNFIFEPRSTVTIGDQTFRINDYQSVGRHFLGFVSSAPFQRVEFDVVSPVNDLFHADNVSFASVPEGNAAIYSIVAICFAVAYRRSQPADRLAAGVRGSTRIVKWLPSIEPRSTTELRLIVDFGSASTPFKPRRGVRGCAPAGVG